MWRAVVTLQPHNIVRSPKVDGNIRARRCVRAVCALLQMSVEGNDGTLKDEVAQWILSDELAKGPQGNYRGTKLRSDLESNLFHG